MHRYLLLSKVTHQKLTGLTTTAAREMSPRSSPGRERGADSTVVETKSNAKPREPQGKLNSTTAYEG